MKTEAGDSSTTFLKYINYRLDPMEKPQGEISVKEIFLNRDEILLLVA